MTGFDDDIDHPTSDIDNLMSYLGTFSKYQKFQFFLHILSAVTAGVHMLSLVTVAATPDFRCAISIDDSLYHNTPVLNNQTTIINNEDVDSCHYLGPDNETVPCNSWLYDQTYYQSSLVIEWDAVCNRRWMAAVTQSAFMFGVFLGSILLGSLADKVGRKPIFIISAYCQLIFGVSVAFMTNFYLNVIFRFLYGMFGSAGAYIPSFVLTMELIGAQKRTLCGISFQAAFALGIMLVAFWGHIISNNMVLLQVVYGLHSAVLLGHVWLMDESPRWLWSKCRFSEAIAIIQKGLKMNGNELIIDPEIYCPQIKVAEAPKHVGVHQLFYTKNLTMKTLNICFCWFANSIAYYGLSLNVGQFKNQFNPFLIIFLMGLVELPNYVIVIAFLDRWGRRAIISVYMIIGGICCILSGALESSEGAIAAMIGKFLIAGSFSIIYNYSAELFPTVVRNAAIGLGSMNARLSGMLTPLIMLLDAVHPLLPSFIFGSMALLSGVWTLWLPETMAQPLPESLEDGENFGRGDTCFSNCLPSNKRSKQTCCDQ